MHKKNPSFFITMRDIAKETLQGIEAFRFDYS